MVKTIQDDNQFSLFGAQDDAVENGLGVSVETPSQDSQANHQEQANLGVQQTEPQPQKADKSKNKRKSKPKVSKRKPPEKVVADLFAQDLLSEVTDDENASEEGIIKTSVEEVSEQKSLLEKSFLGAQELQQEEKPTNTKISEKDQSPQAGFDFSAAVESQANKGLQPSVPFAQAADNETPQEHAIMPNFQYPHNFDIVAGGAKTRARQNIAAIKVVKSINAENRQANPEEREILSQFIGWGGLPQIFDETKEDWADLFVELKNLLGEEEYNAARHSTINAHYTDRNIVEIMWDGVQALGFDGGKVIEPGMGVGYFMGFAPDNIRDEIKLTGIELDAMTGQIARALYPQSDVKIEGFEKTRLPLNSMDMAIGNVPFGNITLGDDRHNRGKHSIHDHFINKSLDLLKPGAFAVFVTSRYTLDKSNPAARKELASKADLVGAIRLPNKTFEKNAGTEVVTDLLVFRKRKDDEQPVDYEWVKTGRTDIEDKSGRINQYYIDNPDMMIGEMSLAQGLYSDNELTWTYKGDQPLDDVIREKMAKIVAHAKANDLRNDPQNIAPEYETVDPDEILIDENMEDYSLYLRDGDIIQYVQGEHRIIAKKGAKSSETVKQQNAVLVQLLKIRDLAKDVLRLQMQDWDGEDDPPWAEAQKELNRLYNRFVFNKGEPLSATKSQSLGVGKDGRERFIHREKYLRLMRDDPSYNFVKALEIYNPETGTAKKADIFTTRVVSPYREITGVENAHDGLLASLRKHAGVDIAYIADLMGYDQQEVIEELGDSVYRNPENGSWETENEYLSGNVRKKLEKASVAAKSNSEFLRNVAALEKVIPEDLAPQDIDISFGAPWIPTDVLEQFVHETLEMEERYHDSLSVEFYPEQALWRVRANSYKYTRDAKVTVEWGTARKPMLEIISDMLNQKSVEVYDTVEKNKKVKNIEETIAAKQKQKEIVDRFRSWIWEDDERAERLARLYNDRYNNIVLRQYDGDHLSMPGLNENIVLRGHQKNVIWRILQSGNTLMGHAVGAGKTLAAIGASMEEKRLGLSNKPLHVVPNHMLEQYAADFQKAYPNAKVLMADKDEFVGDRRRHFVAQCATGNWDAVIMTHSSFGKIGVSAKRETEFLRQRIAEYTSMIDKAKADGDKFTVKMFEKMKKNREEKIQTLLNSGNKDHGITFEEMGVDRIYVDEAHLFKNLEFATRTRGVSQAASQRATDLFMKIGYLEDINPGRSAVFMTGTPIANSVAEAYTMMRYLYLDKMKEKDIDNFDSWIAMFGEFVTALELAPDGGSYRVNERLAKFCNVPELKQMFLEFSDIMTSDMLDLPKPALKGGKHEIITVPASDELQDYIQNLVRRAEAVKNREVEPHEDNMLKITSDGRKAALDLREMGIDVHEKEQEGLKLKYAANEIAKRYHANKDKTFTGEDGEPDFIAGAIQSVFCDLSTPGKDKDFSAYEILKEYLIERGVPAESIRFIHEANNDKKKEKLFEDCRNGKVSIIMGSTSKMGFGTNIQKRMVAQHHLDAPWRPADIEQRDGRIERQGNQNEEIEILRYVTEGSFDVYMWQALERKAKFISQIMSPFEAVMRNFEDNDVKSLSYAEVKAIATGDTRLIEQAEIESKLANLHSLRESHGREQWRLKQDIRSHTSMIDMHEVNIKNTEKTLAEMVSKPVFNIDGLNSDEPKEAGIAVMKQIRAQYTVSNIQKEGYKKSTLGTVHGFPVIVETGGKIGNETLRITVRAPQEIEMSFYEDDMIKMKSDTLLNRIVREFEKLPSKIQESHDKIKEYQDLIAQKSEYIGQGFEKEDEYQLLRSRQKELEEMLRPSEEETSLEQIDIEDITEDELRDLVEADLEEELHNHVAGPE